MKLRAEQRRAQIMAHATRVAIDGFLYDVTADAIAEAVGVKRPTVLYHFGSMQGLRDAVVRTAIRRENLSILAQAIASNDPLVKDINDDLRRRAVLSLAY